MGSIHVASDLAQCRAIWEQVMPSESITDLWEVRDCFQRHFRNRPHFIVSSDQNGVRGLLPLSWIEEQGCYGFFPGEIWQGKTWLEQNRIICNGNGGRENLLSACPSAYHLRYLRDGDDINGGQGVVDETGYLFLPRQHDYDMSKYFKAFSHKAVKNILRDISRIERLGVTYRYDEIADFEIMVSLNIERFGPRSYFHDSRFRESFKDLALFLQEKGWLRFTTVLVDGEPAATDMGCVYRGVYTLLAGGTNPRYPGVAKLINVHHMQWACSERLDQVDFLCGDFNWKKLFHLTPRPLYLLANPAARAA